MIKTVLGIVACVAGVFVFLDKKVFPLAYINGDSMLPTYHDGEIIITKKLFDRQKLKAGDVVVIENKTGVGHDYFIKRIGYFEIENGIKKKVAVYGDNADNSYDSREFGTIPIENVICVLIKSRPKRRV